jgi:hypothetical protein
VANFYDRSEHSDAPAPSAESAHLSQQQANDALKVAAVDAETKAARLFDSMEQGPKVEPSTVAPDEDRAANLYNAASVYVDSVLVAEVPAGSTQEDVAAANASYHQELAKLELSGTTARQITDRFTASMKNPISDAEYDKRVASFNTELGRRFGGAENVAERLADVNKLLAKADPTVLQMFVESGLNVDADTVFELAQHARSLKGRNRL